jgi:prevent-host-death family protein
MRAGIRELKAHLSEMIRSVEQGKTVTVNVRNQPVARLVPLRRRVSLKELARETGIRWDGGKPAGLPRAEKMPSGVLLSDLVGEDRR